MANLPASAIGGGARNTGLGGPEGGGGDACRGGDGTGLADELRVGGAGASGRVPVLRAGGGAGGGPLLEPPVFWGLIGASFAGGALGGGGGGGAFVFRSSAAFSCAFFCSMYILIKSAFSSI